MNKIENERNVMVPFVDALLGPQVTRHLREEMGPDVADRYFPANILGILNWAIVGPDNPLAIAPQEVLKTSPRLHWIPDYIAPRKIQNVGNSSIIMQKNSVFVPIYNKTPVCENYKNSIREQCKRDGVSVDHPNIKAILEQEFFFNQQWLCIFQFHLDAPDEDIELIRMAVENHIDKLKEVIVNMGDRYDTERRVWIGSTDPPETETPDGILNVALKQLALK